MKIRYTPLLLIAHLLALLRLLHAADPKKKARNTNIRSQ